MSVNDDTRPSDQVSDEELVERARSGDDGAMDALVLRHHGAAYRLAVSMVRDGDGAQDVVQDAFVRAFTRLSSFRGDASFRTWLLSVVANEARGALRKAGRRRELPLDEVAEPTARQADADERVALRQEAERARALLARLPEKQRLSVTLRIEEGLSFKEIGAVIGSSEGAARVNFFHGIRRLREWMKS